MTRLLFSDGKWWWNTLLPPRLKCLTLTWMVLSVNTDSSETRCVQILMENDHKDVWPQETHHQFKSICLGTYLWVFIQLYYYIFIYLSHCSYYLHKRYYCIILADKFGIFIVVLVACMARNQYISYNSAIQKTRN